MRITGLLFYGDKRLIMVGSTGMQQQGRDYKSNFAVLPEHCIVLQYIAFAFCTASHLHFALYRIYILHCIAFALHRICILHCIIFAFCIASHLHFCIALHFHFALHCIAFSFCIELNRIFILHCLASHFHFTMHRIAFSFCIALLFDCILYIALHLHFAMHCFAFEL